MKLAIVGQDQLAQVTAICCAPHHERVQPHDAEVLWVCYDTPLNADASPNVSWVEDQLAHVLTDISPRTKVLLSSQLPVGTTARLEHFYPDLTFAYSPENIRVDHGVEDFRAQSRIIVGRRYSADDHVWVRLFAPLSLNNHIIWTDPETAEMVKHATNAYHAVEIAFVNEIACLCHATGADPIKVATALFHDPRVTLRKLPGAAYAGGHLARDLQVLQSVADKAKLATPILTNTRYSNTLHAQGMI